MNLKTTTTFLLAISAGCWIGFNKPLTAQVLSPVQPEEEVTVKDRIASVYALTQSAKKATDYSEIDRQCQSILELDLADNQRQYVNSLASWALCRRGFSRFDLADSFLAAGNRQQSQVVLEQAKTDFDQSVARDASRWRAHLGRGQGRGVGVRRRDARGRRQGRAGRGDGRGGGGPGGQRGGH